MTVTFQPVKSPEDQQVLAQLAHDIWNEYWPAIIGQDQVNYMVANFQSLEAIKRDMGAAQEPYEYWLIFDDEAAPEHTGAIGYTGGHNEAATNRFFISKIYVLKDFRGKGYCSKAIAFYEDLCRARGFSAMYLTVNKYNELALRAYRGKGFETIDSVETDIGQGFIMDDYIMEKKIC